MDILVLACLWVFAATGTALLPMRFQYLPGIGLLIAAPWIILQVGLQFGWLPLLLAAAAVISMFRKPLRYLTLRLAGQTRDAARSRVGAPRA